MKNIIKSVLFFAIIMVLFVVKADECGLEGLTTGGSGGSSVECQTHFYCCDNKVYNGCGTLPDNCRVITSDEIEAYSRTGICTCGCSCYLKPSGDYVWGEYQEGYQKVEGINDKDSCNKFCWKSTGSGETQYSEGITAPTTGTWTKVGKVGEVTCSETPACYKEKTAGTYVWGKYSGNTSYEKVTTVSDEASCKNFCWKSTEGGQTQYSEGITAPTAGTWTKVGVVGEVTCGEAPACYKEKTTGTYTWGKFSGNESYEKVTAVSVEANCANFCWKTIEDGQSRFSEGILAPEDGTWTKVGKVGEVTCSETPACYKEKTTGGYAWGKYHDNENYELIPDTTEEDCHVPEVPVPATGINSSVIFMIAMFMLGLVGVGFIVYSRKYVKKPQV